MCHTAFSYNTPYRNERVFYRIEQIGPHYTIAKFSLFCRCWAFFGNCRPNNGLSVSLQCYYIIYLQHKEVIGNVLGDFGANRVNFGSKIGIPETAFKYDRIIRVFHI